MLGLELPNNSDVLSFLNVAMTQFVHVEMKKLMDEIQ